MKKNMLPTSIIINRENLPTTSNRSPTSTKRLQLIKAMDCLITRQTIGRMILLIIALGVTAHRCFSFQMSHIQWEHAETHFVSRQCPTPNYATIMSTIPEIIQQSSNDDGDDDNNRNNEKEKMVATKETNSPNICITTLTDEKNKRLKTKLLGWRNFDGLLELTWDNKQKYCDRHKYRLFDESDQLDTSRPPNWSKIRGVQRVMYEEKCDWIMWLDADTVVMNSNKKIEDFLPRDQSSDLILSDDDGGGYNSGAFIVRNSPWGREFMQSWWDMKSFVRPTGLSKSGDNHAFKALLKHMDNFNQHCVVPPRCTFNSFAKFVKPGHEQLASWNGSESHYHNGDFIAHVAGVDNKKETIKMLLAIAE